MLIDTHAHLDFPEFANDLDAVLGRAAEAGVEKIITIGTTLESSRRAIELADRYPGVFASIGVHPNHANEERDEFLTVLREMAGHPKVLAIGETGLDYYRLPTKMEKQDVIRNTLGSPAVGSIELEIQEESMKATQAFFFEQQLELAQELGKKVIIHQRDSWDETLAILSEHQVTAVVHCFNASYEQALDVIEMGHMVSFTGIATFKKSAEIRRCAARLPIDRIMVETDCPYLAPEPFRGQRCEPAFVRKIAEVIAQERGLSLEQFAKETTQNAFAFFGI